jgi:tRNA G37 N-methylase Trm5
MKEDLNIKMIKHRSYNFFGNLAVVNFPRKTLQKEKKEFASSLMRKNPSIKTVLEKSGNFRGRLRKMKTSWLAGEKTKEVLYKENNCTFRFNIDETYFSPRLSNERKEICSYIKKGDEVLVMFAGVSPFSIVIAKNSQAKRIYSNELNKIANQYAELNIKLNKSQDKVFLIPGDIKKVAEKIKKDRGINSSFQPLFPRPRTSYENKLLFTTKSLATPANKNKSRLIQENKIPKKFDVIIMPRPQLKDSFLKQAFMLSKKGTEIYYYDFCNDNPKFRQPPPDHPPIKRGINDINSIINKIKTEAKKYKKKIEILRIKNAGEIAPYKIRCRVDFRTLN